VFGRKKNVKQDTDDSSSQGLPSQPEKREGELDLLAERWKSGDESAAASYWNTVMSLDKWFFIGRGSLEQGNVQPFVGSVEGHGPMLQAFTSEQRAIEGAKGLDLSDQSRAVAADGGIAIIEQPPSVAIRSYAHFALFGVRGFRFDGHLLGAFALISNLPGMWEVAGGEPINDLVLPSAPGEFQHLAQQAGRSEGGTSGDRLLNRFLHLDRVGVVTQSLEGNVPATLADGDRRMVLVVASEEGAQATKQFITSKGGEEPGIGAVSVREYIDFLRGLVTSNPDVTHVLIDAGSAFHIESIEQIVSRWNDSPEIQQRQAKAEQIMAVAQGS
jgi:hypothetical protein